MRSEKDINFAIFGTETDPRNDESDIRTLDSFLDRLQGIDERQGKIARKALYNDPGKLEDALKNIKAQKEDKTSSSRTVRDNIEASLYKTLQNNIDSREDTWPDLRTDNKKRLGEAFGHMLRSRTFSSVREDKMNAWNAVDDLMGKSEHSPTRMSNVVSLGDDILTSGPVRAFLNRMDERRGRSDANRARAMEKANIGLSALRDQQKIRNEKMEGHRLRDWVKDKVTLAESGIDHIRNRRDARDNAKYEKKQGRLERENKEARLQAERTRADNESKQRVQDMVDANRRAEERAARDADRGTFQRNRQISQDLRQAMNDQYNRQRQHDQDTYNRQWNDYLHQQRRDQDAYNRQWTDELHQRQRDRDDYTDKRRDRQDKNTDRQERDRIRRIEDFIDNARYYNTYPDWDMVRSRNGVRLINRTNPSRQRFFEFSGAQQVTADGKGIRASDFQPSGEYNSDVSTETSSSTTTPSGTTEQRSSMATPTAQTNNGVSPSMPKMSMVNMPGMTAPSESSGEPEKKKGFLDKAMGGLQKLKDKKPRIMDSILGGVEALKEKAAGIAETAGAAHGLGQLSGVARVAQKFGQAANSDTKTGFGMMKSQVQMLPYMFPQGGKR